MNVMDKDEALVMAYKAIERIAKDCSKPQLDSINEIVKKLNKKRNLTLSELSFMMNMLTKAAIEVQKIARGVKDA